jgi:hypothetical protein
MMGIKIKKLISILALCVMTTSAWSATILSEDFEGGIPANWTVNTNNQLVEWQTTPGPGGDARGNYTNGSGKAAIADSDALNASGPSYDTSLSTPFLDLSTVASVNLDFTANYQHYIDDAFDVDVSTDGGGTWNTVLHWTDDHGSHDATPGEDVSLNLTALAAGKSNVQIRFRYYSLTSNWDWYAEVDNVRVSTSAVPVPLSNTAKALLAMLFAFAAFFMMHRRRVA